MTIFIFGSSQYVNISNIYKRAGHVVYNPIESGGNLLYKFLNFIRIVSSGTIYCVGVNDISKNSYLKIGSALHKKIVVHWIGSDVLWVKDWITEDKIKKLDKYINIAVAEHLCSELKENHIIAECVPIVPDGIPYREIPVPESHRVIIYLPEEKQEFYGIETAKNLARKFPHIPFHIVANSGKSDKEEIENFIYEGNLSKKDLYELYRKSSILLRYPQHDGLPVMMIEALGMGRTVIHRYHYPFVISPDADNMESLTECFKKVIQTPPSTNREAIEYINQTYTYDKVTEVYDNLGLI